MDKVKQFLSNPTAVKVISTLTLFALGAHFLLTGLFEFNLILSVLSLDDYTLYRFWHIIFGILVLFVSYASYVQNKSLVNESLSKAKTKFVQEAKELSKDVKDLATKDEPVEKTTAATDVKQATEVKPVEEKNPLGAEETNDDPTEAVSK
jgi:cell division protein FtsB